MKELVLRVETEEDYEIYYSGYYKSKEFSMIVNTFEGDHYSLLSGDLTKDEWDNVVAMHYNDDYDLE